MKVEIRKQQEVTLDMIKIGEVFQFDSRLFMRTKCVAVVNSIGEMKSWDCVNIKDGSMAFIPLTCAVKKIDAYIIVKE